MTNLELVRLNVRDRTEPYAFDSPTINALLANYGDDVNMASSHLWLLRAGDAARRNFKFTADGRTIDKSMTAKECREQAALFKDLAMLSPGDAVAEVDWTAAFQAPEEA